MLKLKRYRNLAAVVALWTLSVTLVVPAVIKGCDCGDSWLALVGAGTVAGVIYFVGNFVVFNGGDKLLRQFEKSWALAANVGMICLMVVIACFALAVAGPLFGGCLTFSGPVPLLAAGALQCALSIGLAVALNR